MGGGTIRTGHACPAGLQRARSTLENDGLQLAVQSFCLWLPANATIFRYAAVHHRILWISSVAVFWQGFISWVAHGRIERAREGSGERK